MSLALSVVACAGFSPSIPSLAPEVKLDCGPIADRALCVRAAELAATVKLNPPPIVAVRVRRAELDDSCTRWRPACGADAVIVQIQSGDTIQEVPLIASAGGWTLLQEP